MQKQVANIKPSSLTKWTYEFIKGRILNLDYKPGAQIHIDEVADELDLSRTPIREAFLRLVNDGLLEVQPRVGYFVADITEEDIRDLFEIREIIEARAASKAAASLSDEELLEIKRVHAESRIAVEQGDLDAFLKFEMKFHNYLQIHIQNKRITAVMDSLTDLTYRERIISIRSIENIKETLDEHGRILDALLERDGDKAAWFMGEHLKRVSDRIIQLMQAYKKNGKGEIIL